MPSLLLLFQHPSAEIHQIVKLHNYHYQLLQRHGMVSNMILELCQKTHQFGFASHPDPLARYHHHEQGYLEPYTMFWDLLKPELSNENYSRLGHFLLR